MPSGPNKHANRAISDLEFEAARHAGADRRDGWIGGELAMTEDRSGGEGDGKPADATDDIEQPVQDLLANLSPEEALALLVGLPDLEIFKEGLYEQISAENPLRYWEQ
jgi:hypothetical protein